MLRRISIALGAVAVLTAGLVLAVRGVSHHRPTGAASSFMPHLALSAPPAASSSAVEAPPWQEPYFPFLADEPSDRSVSVGCASHGHVVNARMLESDEACAVLPSHRERDLVWGTDELVELVHHAARELHGRSGTRLWVGNLGKRGGGDVSYSVSHNSGRDVDLALCYQDARGRPLDPPELVPLNSEGLAKARPFRFDAARTWILIKALLTHPVVQVQYVFLAKPLKRLLLAHAQSLGEPARLLERAGTIVNQPSSAAVHNDHLHVRIYCSERDVLAGCSNTGAIHPWAELFEDARAKRVEQVMARLADPEPEQRIRALQRLVLLGPLDIAPLLPSLTDDLASVRRAAATAVGLLGEPRHAGAVIEAFVAEPELSVQLAQLGALRDLGGAQAASFLRDFLAAGDGATDGAPEAVASIIAAPRSPAATVLALGPRLWAVHRAVIPQPPPLAVDWQADDVARLEPPQAPEALRLVAIDAAGQTGRLEPVEALLPLLRASSPAVRARAAAALRRLTNRSGAVQWEKPDVSTPWHRRQRQAWRRWIDDHRGQPRDVWLASGFVAAGYRVPQIHQRHIWELVRAVAGAPHLSYNAREVLARLTDHRPPSGRWSKMEACRYWLRWLKRRRQAFRLDRPPSKLVRQCS